MSTDQVTAQLNQIAISGEDATSMMSPPAKLMKINAHTGNVRPAPPQPLADRPSNVVTFDPSLPATARVVNKPVKPVTFALDTGKTPKKNVKRALEKGVPVPLEVMNRWHNCTGIPVRASEYTKNGQRITRKCCMCKTGNTSWYCMGCKSWFCMTIRKDTELREKTFVSTTVKKGKEELVFEMSCFHQKHQAAWEKQEGKEKLELTAKKIHDCAADLKKIKETYGI